jgi:2-amino-4-hydroxy-6-hydroxymethyldihydropteridine diphosphokinase
VITQAYLGLGSNVGDRLRNLQSAADLLDARTDLRVAASSRVWETDPVGGPPQPDYLNAVLEVQTELAPRGLLEACQHVEEALHRDRAVRWGPRTIDVDILLFDDVSMNEPDLTIPHPRLQERAFVVLPLMELAPELLLPGDLPLRSSVVVGGARPFAPPLRTPDHA